MKFRIDYDLLEKINIANGNININRMMLESLRYSAIIYVVYSLLHFDEPLKQASVVFPLRMALDTLLNLVFKKKNISNASIKLSQLVIELNYNLKINTSLELLKEAELTAFEKIPILKRNKYILIPAYDGLENIRHVSILQEHEIGSNKYYLSIGSPTRVLELSHAYKN